MSKKTIKWNLPMHLLRPSPRKQSLKARLGTAMAAADKNRKRPLVTLVAPPWESKKK